MSHPGAKKRMVRVSATGRAKEVVVMVLLFDTEARVWRVRAMMVFSVACLFAPIPILVQGADVNLALALGAVALAFWVGMRYYGTIYVSSLWLVGDQGSLCVETLTMFGRTRRLVPIAQCEEGAYYGSQENAPWITLPVRGRRVPFVLDAQGTFHDLQTLRSILWPYDEDCSESEADDAIALPE
jgi:hypothetical protein